MKASWLVSTSCESYITFFFFLPYIYVPVIFNQAYIVRARQLHIFHLFTFSFAFSLSLSLSC